MKFDRIQIETTTFCNLNCDYCHGRTLPIYNLSEELFEKLAGVAKEYVLYGYGEPLIYPDIIKKAEILGGNIVISTNGMVELDPDIVELADRIGVSIDINDRYRKGLKVDSALKKFEMLEEKGLAEVVVTKNNIQALPEFFETIAQYGAGLLATNVISPNPEIYNDAVYFEGSKRNVELVMDLDEGILIEAIRDCSRGGGKALTLYRSLLTEVYSEGYLINLISVLEYRERVRRAMEAEKIFERIEEIAEDYRVGLISPSFFGDSKSRECPYKNSIFVRADGVVSSCMSFAYSHTEYVNAHPKRIDGFEAGNLKLQDLDEVRENLAEFEALRSDMENFPWCADCPYVKGCWFAESNVDCYANQPSCSECLYSSRIARCLLGF